MSGSIKWIIGLDAHARSCEACAMDHAGVIVETISLRTTTYDLIKLAKRFPAAAIILEESTMAQWLVETLSPYAAEVFVSEPKQNKWMTSGMKSDRLDAYKLASMYLIGSLKQVYHSLDQSRVEFKRTVKHREYLIRQIVAQKNWIKAKYRESGVVPSGAAVYLAGKREETMNQLPESARIRLPQASQRLG